MKPSNPNLSRWYPAVAERAGHRCEYCHAPELLFNIRFEVEHIIPRARGGKTVSDNLALACPACNRHKWAFEKGTDPDTQLAEPLFNPRTQQWEEHFHWSKDFLTLEGLTSIGRATIERLAMNVRRQQHARKRWLRFPDLFP